MKYDSRIIVKPHAVPPLHRTLWGMVTAACWLFFVYLLAPLLTVVLWFLGIRTAYFELYQREHAIEPFLLLVLPLLAVACALLLVGWAEYNRWRFVGRKERRMPQANASQAQVAERLGADLQLAMQLANSKSVTLHMDEDALPRSLTQAAAMPFRQAITAREFLLVQPSPLTT